VSPDPDPEFERAMVERLLKVTQAVIDTVAVGHAAGLVSDIEGNLGRELAAPGVMDMSDEWIRTVAAKIRAGEAVHLPTIDELT
jgi:hypothetical protein